MLILRIAFWIAVVAVLLPSAPSISSSDGTAQAASGVPAGDAEVFDAGAAVDMAMNTGSDVLSFCERNDAVCDTVAAGGSHVANQLIYYTGEAVSWAAQALIDARGAETGTPGALPAATATPAEVTADVPAPIPSQGA
ncbi:MAG: hypothetical protein R8J41_14055 [Alphaproteobacteria bacterium]|uniref:hypothetical protein n=1 Tax=Pyruvatibacter sp. HU-CL02332 TaxID=3127650 RepID=UPI002969A02D|nr:hypothetical protein [Alphaproteobacteria bacterium]